MDKQVNEKKGRNCDIWLSLLLKIIDRNIRKRYMLKSFSVFNLTGHSFTLYKFRRTGKLHLKVVGT